MNISVKYEFLVKYENHKVWIFWESPNFFVKYENFVLFQKIRTLPKNSYFTEIFVVDGKFRAPDVQVPCHCKGKSL